MSEHHTLSARLLRAVLIAGASAVALAGGATNAMAAGSSATAVTKTTNKVDQAWSSSKIREHASVKTRVKGSAATLTNRRGQTLGVSTAGIRKGTSARTVGRTTLLSNAFGRGVDAAVQRTATGVRMLSVIRSANAPTDYRYPLRLPRGATLERQNTGVILIRDAQGRAIGGVRTPWAIDARGQRVKTTFSIRGTTLIQHVAHRGAAYPVVADPSIDFGWTSATLTLNAKDQRIILSGGGAGAGALIGGLLCAETGPGAVLCAAGGAVIGTMVFEAIKEYAVRDNCELKVKIGYFPPGVDDVSTECS